MKDELNRSDGMEYTRPNGSSHGGSGAGLSSETARTAGVGDSVVERGVRDYMLILRERVWYVVVVFLSVFIASLVFTLSSTKLYTATSSIEVLARDPVVMKVQEVRDSDLRGPEDLNTQIKILESSAIVQRVAEQLSPEDAKTLLAPYEKAGDDAVVPEDILGKNRQVTPVRMSRILQISFTHPDPSMAAKVANLFVDQYLNYNSRQRVDESMRAVEDLKVRADQQSKKVEELGHNLQAYKERENMVSLDQRKDIVTEKLKSVSEELTKANSRLDLATIEWKQVQDCIAANGNLANLAFISTSPVIQTLQQSVGTKRIEVADLRQRYRDGHPRMQEAAKSLEQTETELKRSLDDAAAKVHNEFLTASSDVATAKANLAAQETEALKLDRMGIEYNTLQNELDVNQQLLASLVTRMRETSMNASIESYNARVLDAASRPRKYSSPNVALNLGAGGAVGILLGLGLAFFVAFIDDRVKSAFQIESVVGLPLIGIIPRFGKGSPEDKTRAVLNNIDPLVAESFLTLHSNLRLNEASKNAKVILVTSTTPGEGKTFVSSNLALKFAEHGEKVVIIDCDLRKPSVHKAFNVQNNKGVIDYCSAGEPLKEVLLQGLRPNLDMIPAGGRAANPTHVLNHKGFASLISELRLHYDRVFIDSPPLAPVSDAKIINPHVDGSIFVIRFNRVRTKGAKFCARQLIDASAPCFGAVLNGLDLALSDYYYAEYHDKSYKDYLTAAASESDS